MLDEREDLEYQIQEYQYELERYEQAIDRLKIRIGKKKKQLEELKMKQIPKKTLLEIIVEWNDDEENPPCEALLNRIFDWLPNEYVSCNEYNEGWNQCLHTIKTNLRPSQELETKNLPYFVGN